MNNHTSTHPDQVNLGKLRKLYLNKCLQAEKAKLLSNAFMYQVLKAEADTIRCELDKL